MKLTELVETMKADIEMFRLVHSEPGFMKYLYYSDVRTVAIFRLSTYFYANEGLRPLAYALTVLNDLIAGVWIGPKADIGPGFFLGHARGTLIHPTVKIGRCCAVLHRVTVGGPNVTVGDFVEINCAATVISNDRGRAELHVGSHATIGAGAVVVDDVPEGGVAVGIPARVVKLRSPDENWVAFRIRQNESGVAP